MTFTYTLGPAGFPTGQPTDLEQMRLLLNDVDSATAVFQDEELAAFLLMEGGAVKLAAAQAIDTNADDQALASKVLRSQDVQTDGAKLAQVLHQRAESLRNQHFNDLEDGGFFAIVDAPCGYGPELTERSWY